jgi:hypothetical protein
MVHRTQETNRYRCRDFRSPRASEVLSQPDPAPLIQ